MYCPKCNARLEEDPRGWLRCSSGELELSIDLSRRLRETYARLSRDGATVPNFTARDFFCPGCGVAIPKDASDYPCSSCGVSLRPLVHALIELHPHGNRAGKYF
jgi:hypothetical protein